MKQILIATHGKMASGIRYTAELIVGQLAEITTIDAYVTPEDNVEEQFKEFFEKHKEDRPDGRKRKPEADGVRKAGQRHTGDRNKSPGTDAGHACG